MGVDIILEQPQYAPWTTSCSQIIFWLSASGIKMLGKLRQALSQLVVPVGAPIAISCSVNQVSHICFKVLVLNPFCR
ncbi:hypothetical protein O9929_00770 [Vibrio lentus]|nr:hypothetical protein [Vibrio lentus]